MTVELYDVIFTGELVNPTTPEVTQRNLTALFRLDGSQIEQLFSGRRIFVKRNLDLDTAARLQDAFRKAGGKVSIEPVAAFEDARLSNLRPPGRARASIEAVSQSDLTLAPVGTSLDQIDDLPLKQSPDTSALSLMSDQDWTLADCAPPPAPNPEFDLDDLELVPLVVSSPDTSGA